MRYYTKVLIERDDEVWRALKGTRAKKVAEYMGVSQVRVSHWKYGRLMMSLDQYQKLCEYLGVKA